LRATCLLLRTPARFACVGRMEVGTKPAEARFKRKGIYAMKIALTVSTIIGVTSFPQSAMASTQSTPSWEIIGMGAIGLLVAVVGAYARGVADRVSHTEEKIGELNTFILREYHSKADVKLMLDDIKTSMNSLHAKFEKFEGLYGR